MGIVFGTTPFKMGMYKRIGFVRELMIEFAGSQCIGWNPFEAHRNRKGDWTFRAGAVLMHVETSAYGQ